MKLLVVSHSCVVDANQRIYSELERELGHVNLVVPRRWFHEHTRGPLSPQRSIGFGGEILALPVFRPGSVQLHAYAAAAARLMRRLRPDLLYIE